MLGAGCPEPERASSERVQPQDRGITRTYPEGGREATYEVLASAGTLRERLAGHNACVKAHDILVIVTTLELDARHKKFKDEQRSRGAAWTRGSSTYANMSPTFVRSC